MQLLQRYRPVKKIQITLAALWQSVSGYLCWLLCIWNHDDVSVSGSIISAEMWEQDWVRRWLQLLVYLLYVCSIKSPSRLTKWEDVQGPIHAVVPTIFTQAPSREIWRPQHFYFQLVSTGCLKTVFSIIASPSMSCHLIEHWRYSVTLGFFYPVLADV